MIMTIIKVESVIVKMIIANVRFQNSNNKYSRTDKSPPLNRTQKQRKD